MIVEKDHIYFVKDDLLIGRLHTLSDSPSSHNVGNGPLIWSQQQNTTMQNNNGSQVITLESLQKQIVALGETVGPMGLIVNQLQEQQNSGIKNNNTCDEQLQQDLFRGSSYNYQQQKKQ